MAKGQEATGDRQPHEPIIPWQHLFRAFWRIGVLSFGGPAAQIALMHRVLVEEEEWLDEASFLNALSFCMLLPGPEAMQLVTYAGWQIRGVWGGLLAGLLFVIPGAVVVLGLRCCTWLRETCRSWDALFVGIQGAVLVIVVAALLKLAKKALHRTLHWGLASMAFVSIFFLSVPFPFIILVSGLIGYFLLADSPLDEHAREPTQGRSLWGTVRTVGVWLTIWWAPLGVLSVTGDYPILVELGHFFSRLPWSHLVEPMPCSPIWPRMW